MRELMAWHREERVEGRKSSWGVSKSKHLDHHSGSSTVHLAFLATAHSHSLWPHHSHFFPSLGLSSSIDGPIYILLLLQVQVKAQPQEAFQDISSLTPFFMKSDSHVHSSMLQTFRRRKTHRRGLHLQVASKGKHEARLLHTK